MAILGQYDANIAHILHIPKYFDNFNAPGGVTVNPPGIDRGWVEIGAPVREPPV